LEAEEIKERLLKLLDTLRPYAPSFPIVSNLVDRMKASLKKVPPEVLAEVIKELREILEGA